MSSALPTTSRWAPACSSRDSGTCRRGDGDGDGGDRQVDDEDPAPRHRVDQVATQERSDRGRDPAQARPRADGPAAVLGCERRRDHRQAVGDEERGGDALRAAGGDERAGVGRDRAQQRRRRERDQADLEDLAAAVPVTERAAEHQERAQGEQVPGEHPLEIAEVGVQVTRDRGERGVHDGAVEERHSGSEHRGGDHPPAPRGAHVQIGRTHASSEPRAWQNQSHAQHVRPYVEREGVGPPRRPPRRGRARPPLHRSPPRPRGHVAAGVRRPAPGRPPRPPARPHRRHDGPQRPDREHPPARRRPGLGASRWRCWRPTAPSSASASTRWARRARASCT